MYHISSQPFCFVFFYSALKLLSLRIHLYSKKNENPKELQDAITTNI